MSFGRARMTNPEVVARIVAERAAGGSYTAIAAGLDADAVPTPNGAQRWQKTTVVRLHGRATGTEVEA